MINLLRQIRKREEGSVVVEAALLLPIMLTLGLGAVDASNMMLQNHKIETQLVMAGNYLAKSQTPNLYETQAKNLASTGQLESGGTEIIPGWSASDVSVSYSSVTNATTASGTEYLAGSTVTVVTVSTSVSYQGFGILRSMFGPSIQLTGSYEERVIGTA